ncbi:MAG TPA: acylphosphatase [Phototrophicaceae bacterium]|nr:acylphosphatase [Phototrophicaceae bacterium]
MPDLEPLRLKAIVRGKVQGVSFRWYTQQTALPLKLTGYARNLPNRSVEVIAEGERAQLETLLQFLHVGPPTAHVEGVEVEWLAATGEFTDFSAG